MLDVVPFMAIVVVVVIAVAAWGAARERAAVGDLERLPDAEAALQTCLEGHGVDRMPFRVFRDPADRSIVITGPEVLAPDLESALLECDRVLDPFRT